jgi:hypothetical protein
VGSTSKLTGKTTGKVAIQEWRILGLTMAQPGTFPTFLGFETIYRTGKTTGNSTGNPALAFDTFPTPSCSVEGIGVRSLYGFNFGAIGWAVHVGERA